MTSRQAKIQEDTHFRIMRILQDNPDLTQRELADKLGMSEAAQAEAQDPVLVVIPLEIIETQSGSYLGEDDIVRFEDTYGRR